MINCGIKAQAVAICATQHYNANLGALTDVSHKCSKCLRWLLVEPLTFRKCQRCHFLVRNSNLRVVIVFSVSRILKDVIFLAEIWICELSFLSERCHLLFTFAPTRDGCDSISHERLHRVWHIHSVRVSGRQFIKKNLSLIRRNVMH